MNARRLTIALAVAAAFVAAPAFAHDPKEHEKEAAAKNAGPDCAKLKAMDTSKLDPNDPVVKALQLKCARAAAQGGKADDGHAHDHGKDDKKKDADGDDHGSHGDHR